MKELAVVLLPPLFSTSCEISLIKPASLELQSPVRIALVPAEIEASSNSFSGMSGVCTLSTVSAFKLALSQ